MEKRTKDDPESPADRYADFEPAPAPMIGAAAIGFVGPAAAAPAWNEDNVICARGPCRHLWHLVTTVGEGNPEGTWEALGIAQPRQHSYTCTVNPGMETEFVDDAVFECNRWDPLTTEEIAAREYRRGLYQIRKQYSEPVERIEDAVDDEDVAQSEKEQES